MFRKKTTETTHATVRNVPLVHGNFRKYGHVKFRYFAEHVPASLLPEFFRTLTEILLTVWAGLQSVDISLHNMGGD